VFISSSSIVAFLVVEHLVVEAKIGRVGQMTLLVGVALAEAFIHLHAADLKLLLTDRQARDAPQCFDIGDPVVQGALDGFEKNRSRHPAR